MPHDRFKTLPGIPGYEDTAVTMKSIKEILEDEGASHLLRRREPETNSEQPAEAPRKPGPLQQLALQTPPTVAPKPQERPKTAPRDAFPSIQSAEETYQEEPVRPKTGGLIPRLFGRK